MDLALIFGIILIVIGWMGIFLPLLPGLPLIWSSLIVLKIVNPEYISNDMLWTTGGITAFIVLLDYLLPIYMTKKMGGSKLGILGATIGLIVGLFFFPPIGFIIGAIIGTFTGELIKTDGDMKKTWKATLGTILGFILNTVFGMIAGAYFTYIFVKAII